MFLPFQTSLSMWFAAQPVYEYEPEPPPALPADAASTDAPGGTPAATATAEGAAAATGSPGAPATPPTAKQRLVFKGIEWRAFQVRHAVENPAWALASQNRKDEDESRSQSRSRPLPRPVELSVPAPAEESQAAPGGDTQSSAS